MKKIMWAAIIVMLAIPVFLGATCSGTMQSVALDPATGKPLMGPDGLPVILTHEVDYNTVVALTNKASAENPRVAVVVMEKDGVKTTATIPLDSWRQPINPESPGKQIKQVAEGVTPLGAIYVVGDTLKSTVSNSGVRSTTVNQSSQGDLSPVSAPGGNMGALGGTITTPAPVVVPPVVVGP